MTAPRRITSYPSWLLQLAAEFKRGAPIGLEVTPEQYYSLRRLIYGLQTAITKATPAEREELGEFLAARLEYRDGVLHIRHVDDLFPEPQRRS